MIGISDEGTRANGDSGRGCRSWGRSTDREHLAGERIHSAGYAGSRIAHDDGHGSGFRAVHTDHAPAASFSSQGGLRRKDPDQQRCHHLGNHRRRSAGSRLCLRRQHGRGVAVRQRQQRRVEPCKQGQHEPARRPPRRKRGRRNPVDRPEVMGLHGGRRSAAGRTVCLPRRRCSKQLDRRCEPARHRRATAGGRIDRARAHSAHRWNCRHRRPGNHRRLGWRATAMSLDPTALSRKHPRQRAKPEALRS